MAKNKQQIKFEADVTGFKNNIKEAEKSITSLNNQLKLNQSQLKGNKDDTNLLSQRIETLNQKYSEQKKVVENTRASYEKAVEIFGENSKEAENLKNKLLKAETAEQNIKNEIDKTNQKLKEQTDKLITTSKKWQESGKRLKEYGSKIESVGNKVSIASGIVVGAGITSIKSAIGIETSIQQVENIYGKASDKIKDFAENTAMSFNMSKSEAYKYSQVFGNLIQSITDDQQKNAQYTQELLKASAVIASSTGRTMEDVMDRIRSGLLGNTEAIEDLGVNVNVSLLESTDAFKKFAGNKSWKQLDFQTQQQIRLFAILEQTTKKYGDEVQQNTNTSIQQLTAKTKNLTSNLGQKLLPTANKILDKANDLIESFGDLSDEEQENILKIGGLIAVAGPAIKIGGNIIKTVGNVKTGIGTLTGAIGVLKNGTEGANASSISLANTIKSWTNPFTISVASITLAHSILSKLTSETNEHAKACKQSAEETHAEKQAIDELRDSIDSRLNVDLANIERTKTLWEELQKITDENGKIKKGYQNRAKVITGELSEALGTEITLTGNAINNYKELQKQIDKLILKKKSEAILNAFQEKYNEAITNRDQKTQELIDKEEEYSSTLRNRNSVYASLTNSEKKYYEALKGEKLVYLSKKELDSVDKAKIGNLQNLDNAVNSSKNNVADLRNMVNDYTKDIEEYEYNLKLSNEGTTESIQKMVDNIGNTHKKNGETVKTSYLEQIQAQQHYLQQAKTLNEEAVASNNETEKQKSQSTIDESARRIQVIIQELASHTQLLGENSEDVINSWKELSTNSHDIFVQEISKLSPDMQIKINELITGVNGRTEEFKFIMQRLAKEGVSALDKNAEFRAKAVQSLNSYLQGLSDEEKRNLLKKAGIKNVEKVIEGLKKGNLSKDEGVELLKNLYNGLGDTWWQKNLFGRASSIASQLSRTLTVNATINGNKVTGSTLKGLQALGNRTLPGHKSGLDYVPYDNYIARLHKGERVLTADENKEYMASNIENKVSNRSITVQFFPQRMTETELQRAESYIAKKWGMAL